MSKTTSIILMIILVAATWFVTSIYDIDFPLPKRNDIFKPSPTEKIIPERQSIAELERLLFKQINDQREANDTHPLTWSDNLHQLARQHTADMLTKGELYHSNNNIYENVYRSEGIPLNADSIHNILDTWLGSPGHEKNLLANDASYGAISIAVKGPITYATYTAD